MCNVNILDASPQELTDRYEATLFEDLNLFKSNLWASAFSYPQWAVITLPEPKTIKQFQWGFVPENLNTFEDIKKFRKGKNLVNARCETIDTPYRAFTPAFELNQRCIIPSTGFYEWRHQNGLKVPYYIRQKGEPIFSMAGVYSYWQEKNTEIIRGTFSIITCPANEKMAYIHNAKKRMPVLLTKESEKDWLNPNTSDETLKAIMSPIDNDLLTAITTKSPLGKDAPKGRELYDYEMYKDAKTFID